MAKIKPGDTAIVGDEVVTPTEQGVTIQDVKLGEKNYTRGGVTAKRDKAQATVVECNRILALMPPVEEVV